MDVVDHTADDIEAYLRRRLNAHSRIRTQSGLQTGGRLKASTVPQEYRILRRVLNVAVKKKRLRSNPCDGVEFPATVRSLFRPHYVTWSEQQAIEQHAPAYLRHVVQIITEMGLRVYKELLPTKKEQVDLDNGVLWVPNSKTANGVAEVPLTERAREAIRNQMQLAGDSPFLFPSEDSQAGHLTTLKKGWRCTLRKAGVAYFRLYDLRSTFATRLSAGGVADEWVTQLLRQGDAKVFKKYSQMKREALESLNCQANEEKSSETVAAKKGF